MIENGCSYVSTAAHMFESYLPSTVKVPSTDNNPFPPDTHTLDEFRQDFGVWIGHRLFSGSKKVYKQF